MPLQLNKYPDKFAQLMNRNTRENEGRGWCWREDKQLCRSRLPGATWRLVALLLWYGRNLFSYVNKMHK